MMESCAAEGGKFEKLTDINSVHDFVVSSIEKKAIGQTPLVLFCNGGADSLKENEQSRSEGQILSELISSVEKTGEKYSVLYVSDPTVIRYPSYRQLDRGVQLFTVWLTEFISRRCCLFANSDEPKCVFI